MASKLQRKKDAMYKLRSAEEKRAAAAERTLREDNARRDQLRATIDKAVEELDFGTVRALLTEDNEHYFGWAAKRCENEAMLSFLVDHGVEVDIRLNQSPDIFRKTLFAVSKWYPPSLKRPAFDYVCLLTNTELLHSTFRKEAWNVQEILRRVASIYRRIRYGGLQGADMEAKLAILKEWVDADEEPKNG